jgi:hypothetical protein
VALTQINNEQISNAAAGNASAGIDAGTKIQTNSITGAQLANTIAVTTSGNIAAGAILTDNYFYANGAPFSGGGGGNTNYTDANVSAYLSSGTANANIITTANVSGAFVLGNGSALTSITGTNVVGNVPNADFATTATSTVTAGTVTTNAQPNITSVGTLTSLTLAGNIIPSANNAFTLGNLTNQWSSVYVGANTIYFNGVPLSSNVTTLFYDNKPLVTESAGGNISTGGNVAAGNVIANGFFYGNGTPLVGAQGTTGAQGIQGIQGTEGTQGTVGAQGETGTQGATGTQGFDGTQGTTGAQGTEGIQGTTGTQGFDGTQGTTGAQGTEGIQGTTGTQGNTGTGVQIIGSAALTAGNENTELLAAFPGATAGQGVVNSTDGTLWVYQGASTWASVGNIVGAQGATGTQGLVGTQGTTGAQGTEGVQGHDGAQGTQGIQGDTGAQGTEGIQGHDGAQGIQGVQGETGAQGTEGIQGHDGAQGTQGIQGLTGTQGETGTQGTEGTQGIQGFEGTQGIQGETGIQGFDGTQGIQGTDGLQGIQGTDGIQGPSGPSTTINAADTAVNAEFYPVFVAATGSDQTASANANITVNPSTGVITSGGIITVGTASTGNITGAFAVVADYLYGDGSNITNLTAGNSIVNGNSSVRIPVANGDIALATNGANVLIIGALGLVEAKNNFQALGNITGGNVVTTGNITGGNVVTTGNVSGGNLVTGGRVVATGNITGANIVATYLYGNGSNITNVPTIVNGTSNVAIPVADGAVSINVGGSANIASFNQSNIVFTDGTNTAFTFDLAAKFLTMIDAADNQVGVAPTEIAMNSTNADYQTQLLPGAWSLADNIAAGSPQTYITPGFVTTYYGGNSAPVMPTNPDHLTTKAYVDEKSNIANGTSIVDIATADGNIVISVANTQNWAFDTGGGLTFPDATVQTTAYTGPVTPPAEGSFTVESANFAAVAGSRYGVDASGGNVTATLPATPDTGAAIFFADAGGYSASNLLNINSGLNTIMGGGNVLTVSTPNQSVGLFWNGTTWRTY